MIALSLLPGTELLRAGAELSVRHPDRGSSTMRAVPPDALGLLVQLAAGNVELPADPPAELDRLAGWGLLRYSCVDDGVELLTAVLTSELMVLRVPAVPAGASLRLSRFAQLRLRDGSLVAESPLTCVRVTLCEPSIAALLASLAVPRPARELTPTAALPLLLAAGILTTVDQDGHAAEDERAEVRQREPLDLALHNASRRGLTDDQIGAVYPFTDLPPSPALVPGPTLVPGAPLVPGPPRIELYTPDLAALARTDPPLVEVMERRRSVRRFGARPLTAEQLGEFLYRTVRVRSVYEVAVDDETSYEVTDRPVPAAGGAHDLEYYVTVVRCDGLAPGIYRYLPAEHALTVVTDDRKWTVGMADEAYRCAGSEAVPHVLITMASRFARLTWKYRGIAHTLTLKNVGVVYEAMYLAATAMGLAPCALGHGNAALFSRATGLDPLVESSVGEFLLGTAGE